MKKAFFLVVFFLLGSLDAFATHIGTITIDVRNASTIADYLTRMRWQERCEAGFNDPDMDTILVTDQTINAMNYDALIQAGLLKIGDAFIKYVDGNIVRFADIPVDTIALPGFFSLAFFTLSHISIQNNGPGSLAAKIALFSIGAGFGIVAAKKLVKKLKNIPEIMFDKYGFSYKKSNQIHTVKWFDIKKIHIDRKVAISKPEGHAIQNEPTHVEYIRAYLMDESGNTLCSYCPFQTEHFAEIVSYYRGKALSLPADSLPITVKTELLYPSHPALNS